MSILDTFGVVGSIQSNFLIHILPKSVHKKRAKLRSRCAGYIRICFKVYQMSLLWMVLLLKYV